MTYPKYLVVNILNWGWLLLKDIRSTKQGISAWVVSGAYRLELRGSLGLAKQWPRNEVMATRENSFLLYRVEPPKELALAYERSLFLDNLPENEAVFKWAKSQLGIVEDEITRPESNSV